ncbi:hypothetical protein ZEAMMB73_Zm00001d032220 [Zea mays]|uniref:Uncharacterized protein n=1 Tax=Zea mays TaxID=4577 RepID=A0A1D6KP89_MAIZE|nr:hypothetical protein ZEAMMB73_Zm00001d032220 [Zea mays]ONM04629.1 hypothetical protein ZEAMMB73_Zm00001d032220 [Zea mays]ONM04632.1 hypothetical protein ZEAMMB73_Zm00001d032220 [Zea mays]ONM04636.1 hypothetical protein ZEAMMB73_Zm00001d032220 [Zea mays]ONM04638.1 hypothetical protein ZEAMMB73_Zm00001d032220 [Zea mays]|eukprot:XP_023157097.1 gamma-glutamylcyclotransferase 2-2 isoform X2 [Zea mays]
MRSSRRCAACRGFLQGGEHGGGARSSRGTDQEHWRGEEIEEALCFLGVPRQQLGAACIDHRGTPEHPARTCTLETDDEAMPSLHAPPFYTVTQCYMGKWGIAYCVKGGPEKELKAMQYLERRECEYDQKISIDFYKEGDPLKPAVMGVLVFVSTPDPIGNKYYLGPAPLQNMARPRR